ncbi:MAG: DUF3105 domain-containing protein [Candidatus Saccharibacteria bacterium]
MSKFTIITVSIIAIFIMTIVLIKVNQPTETLIGTKHPNQGEKHIARGQSHEAYNSDLPSSGPHYEDAKSPTDWGIYTEIIQPEVFLHNEEHGGVIIAYSPSLLPADQLKKLQTLFAPPYDQKDFKPAKFILAPRPTNKKAIQLASWNWTYDLDGYDAASITKFYLQHGGKAPEALAGPNNAPINQAAL